MKYNTIGCSSLSSEGKKSTLTIYADLDLPEKNKDPSMESEVVKLKEELLQAQTALDKQTKRCRQLVAEFTRKLQEKESQYEHEKTLREDQLAKLLRALLLVEARLKQEQKLITHQLREKDFIIQKQSNDLKKLLSGQYCKSCSQIYNSSANLESLDSSSEYIITDYQESNFGSMDSSSELYATLSDKDSSSNKSHLLDDSGSNATNSSDLNGKRRYQKNRGKDSLERKVRKFPHRKSVGTYFEVLKLRSDNASPYSNEDNTSNDYDNFDSLPPESVADRMSVISRDSDNSYHYESIEKIDNVYNNDHDLDTANNLSLSESNITVIHAPKRPENTDVSIEKTSDENQTIDERVNRHTEHKLSDSIAVFDAEAESNDKWYVNASDQEDEQQKSVYRNNPVLECVNQILLQNINDSLNSPPKTPNVERKSNKNKRVKFSDQKIMISEDKSLTQENLKVNVMNNENHNYYETPVHKVPNFYESPQSIYSNDYEQILSRCSETFSSASNVAQEMGQQEEIILIENNENLNVLRKNKILRIPPALPPKPSNLLSKYKIQNNPLKLLNLKSSDAVSLDSEPDYCSISELNLPADRIISKRIQVIAEINPSAPRDPEDQIDPPDDNSQKNEYDDVENDEMIMKNIDKVNIQVAKQTTISSEESSPTQKSPSKLCQEIPKLPQVSEIIIPEDSDKEKEEIITQDNYVKNNSQMMKIRNSTPKRRPISMGSSVSSLIMGFNNRELMYELSNKKPPSISPPKKIFSSFENLHVKSPPTFSPKSESDNQSQNDYNLIQNFEEFKLDDCEIEEYIVPDSDGNENSQNTDSSIFKSEETIELIRTVEGKGKSDEDISVPSLNRKSLELLKKHLNIQNMDNETKDKSTKSNNEPTYEHFLECTGLSSKSILTPSRVGTTHKTVLKPRDIKLRSRTKAYSFFDTASIGSGSEPFV